MSQVYQPADLAPFLEITTGTIFAIFHKVADLSLNIWLLQCCSLHPNSRLPAVRELNAGSLKGLLNGRDRVV